MNWKKSVEEGANPRDIKLNFAKEIVARFHSLKLADEAELAFMNRFQKGILPSDIPEIRLEVSEGVTFPQILKQAGLVSSTSDVIRLIKQGAVKLEGEKVESVDCVLMMNGLYLIQVGKRRVARITLYC